MRFQLWLHVEVVFTDKLQNVKHVLIWVAIKSEKVMNSNTRKKFHYFVFIVRPFAPISALATLPSQVNISRDHI